MKQDIILAGVGGQGILTIAYMLDNAAVAAGYRFKQAEVHGMAQRGGSVYSHMRFSDTEVVSDLIPYGTADMILSVEPLEVQRYLHYLRPGGVVIANNQPHKNILDYPDDRAVLDACLAIPNCLLVDAKEIATRGGSAKAENMAMVGVATPYLPFSIENFVPFVHALFDRKGERVVAANLAVLSIGYRVGAFSKALLQAGVSSMTVSRLLDRVLVETVDPEKAERAVQVLARGTPEPGPRVSLETLLAG